MNAFLQAIDFYKNKGYEIKTSLNPMHFSHARGFIKAYSAYLPFTYIIAQDKGVELRTGGGDTK